MDGRLRLITGAWYSFTPRQLGEVSGEVHLSLIDRMLKFFGIGGSVWV